MNGNRELAAVSALENGGRVLVTRLQYLGDIVLSLPLVRALRERFPKAEIDYLGREGAVDILEGETCFSQIHRVRPGISAVALVAALRRRRYDVTIDLYGNPRSALLCWLTGASLRVGGNRRARRHLYTHPTRVPKTIRSAIEHHLYYARVLGIDARATKPVLNPSEDERRRAAALLGGLGVDMQQPAVGLHPGGKWEVKRWAPESFVELGRRLQSDGLQVLVMAGPGEAAHRRAVLDGLGSQAVELPTLPLRDTAAIISALNAFVACDGGVMHVAVAVGTPTVGIFGSSEPDIWFPYDGFGPFMAAWVPIACRPCHLHTCGHLSCLRSLDVSRVEAGVRTVLGGASFSGTGSAGGGEA